MSLFGEIVEPTSRTVWEDWDEIISIDDDLRLQWQNHVEIIEKIDTFYFLGGKYLTELLRLQLQRLELVNSIKEINLHLYKLKALNKYICVINDYNLVLSSEIVKLLQPYVETCRNVITVQTSPMSEYRTHQLHTEPCVIRGIYTSKANNLSDTEFPKLEQPNILSGVAAGVLALREHLNLIGVALICFIENTEDDQVAELQKLLNKLEIGPNCQAVLTSVLKSNLYI